MGAGVDPDCELFASGIVKDDEDDWGVGAHALAVKQAVVVKEKVWGPAGRAAACLWYPVHNPAAYLQQDLAVATPDHGSCAQCGSTSTG
jgi:hypothetical protein